MQFSLAKVLLYLERLAGDHDSTPEGLRKAVTLKEACRVHSASGAFLFFMEKLQAMCPASDFPEIERGLYSQFRSGFLDDDLVAAVEEQVPAAADLSLTKTFRSP